MARVVCEGGYREDLNRDSAVLLTKLGWRRELVFRLAAVDCL